MSPAANNCFVIAIHKITGEPHQNIVDGIAAFPDKAGRPAFAFDGEGDGIGVRISSVESYLGTRGWDQLFFVDCPSIPWTCIVSVLGHGFAIVDGCIHDVCGGNYEGEQIISIFVPPNAIAPASADVTPPGQGGTGCGRSPSPSLQPMKEI